jgi:multiple sugar transport system substrate-binding protein
VPYGPARSTPGERSPPVGGPGHDEEQVGDPVDYPQGVGVLVRVPGGDEAPLGAPDYRAGDVEESPEVSKIETAQIGIAPLPAGEGGQSFAGLGGWNMMINANSQRQEEAWEFVKWMTSEQGQRQRALAATLLPTRKSLYEDQEILEKVPVIRLGKEAIQSTKSRPVSPYYSDMSLAMAEQFNLSLKGETDPQAAVQSLQEELTKIVEQGS